MDYAKLEINYFGQVIEIALSKKSPSFNWDQDKLMDSLKGAQCYGALDKAGMLIAYAFVRRLNPETMELESLATRQGFEKRGTMLGLLENILKECSKSAKFVWLEVHPANVAALQLYTKLGFVQTGSRVSYYKDGSDAILCTKVL